MGADTTIKLANDEGFNAPGVYGLSDPFPGVSLDSAIYRRLIETRMVALADAANIQQIGVPSWNDVIYGVRSVYGADAAIPRPRNLLFGYSPAAKFGFGNASAFGSTAAATDTDVTGKTINFSVNLTRLQYGGLGSTSASTGSVDVGAGNAIVFGGLCLNDATVSSSQTFYGRYTDANNWLSAVRQAATNVRITKNVASVTATELDVTVPSTEVIAGAALFVRLVGTTVSVYLNGTRYANAVTLSAGAQGLTGTLFAFDSATPGRKLVGEMEVWSTTAPYNTR